MRTLSAPAKAALAGQSVPMVLLVDLLFSSPDYLATGGWDITWNGNTYLGTGVLMSIDAVTEATGDPRGIRITFSGVPSDMLALGLADTTIVQGKTVNLWVCVLDPVTYQPLDASLEWSGTVDTMTVDDGAMGEQATVQLTAEHMGIDLLRNSPARWTDVDQQRLYPGDKGLQFIASTAAAQIVWPAASFFKA